MAPLKSRTSPALFPLLAFLVCASLSAGETSGPVNAERAKEIVLAQTGGGVVIELDRHYRGDRGYVFKLVVDAGDGVYVAEVEADTGKMLRFIRKKGYRDSRGYRGSRENRPRGGDTAPRRPESGAGSRLSLEEAKEIALQHTKGGVVVESEMDSSRRHGIVYEFEIINNGSKFELEIAASDGSLVEFKQKHGRYPSPALPPKAESGPTASSSGGGMGAMAAQNLALEEVGGGDITEYKLKSSKGRLIHEVIIRRGNSRYELEIDDADRTVIERSVKQFD